MKRKWGYDIKTDSELTRKKGKSTRNTQTNTDSCHHREISAGNVI